MESAAPNLSDFHFNLELMKNSPLEEIKKAEIAFGVNNVGELTTKINIIALDTLNTADLINLRDGLLLIKSNAKLIINEESGSKSWFSSSRTEWNSWKDSKFPEREGAKKRASELSTFESQLDSINNDLDKLIKAKSAKEDVLFVKQALNNPKSDIFSETSLKLIARPTFIEKSKLIITSINGMIEDNSTYPNTKILDNFKIDLNSLQKEYPTVEQEKLLFALLISAKENFPPEFSDKFTNWFKDTNKEKLESKEHTETLRNMNAAINNVESLIAAGRSAKEVNDFESDFVIVEPEVKIVKSETKFGDAKKLVYKDAQAYMEKINSEYNKLKQPITPDQYQSYALTLELLKNSDFETKAAELIANGIEFDVALDNDYKVQEISGHIRSLVTEFREGRKSDSDTSSAGLRAVLIAGARNCSSKELGKFIHWLNKMQLDHTKNPSEWKVNGKDSLSSEFIEKSKGVMEDLENAAAENRKKRI